MRAHALIDRRASVDDAEPTARASEDRADDLVWPPPADDLDRVEVVSLQAGEAADPPRRDDYQRPSPPVPARPVAPPPITVAAATEADATLCAPPPVLVDLPAGDDDVDAFRDERETGVLPWHDVEVRPRHAPRALSVAALLVVAAVAGVAVGGQAAAGRWEGWARQSAAVANAAQGYWQDASDAIARAMPGEAPAPTPVQGSTPAAATDATSDAAATNEAAGLTPVPPADAGREADTTAARPAAAPDRGATPSEAGADAAPAPSAGDVGREVTRVADVASAVPRPTSPPLSQQVGSGGGAAPAAVPTPASPVDRDASGAADGGAGPGANREARPTAVRSEIPTSAAAGAAAESRAVETPTPRPPERSGAGPAPRDPRDVGGSSAAAAPAPSSSARVSTPAPPPSPAPAASAEREPTPPAAVAITPAATQRRDESQVRTVLARYATAYGQLDAGAAQAVWPSVDARALSRAFSGLESQSLEFSRCDLDVRASVARAECLGRATYVTRVGSKAPRSVSRTWSFQLRKVGDGWQIVDAATR